MSHLKSALLVSVAIVATGAALADAAELKQVGAIAIPGEKLVTFDISFVDHAAQVLYFADRSNKSIDIFDLKTDTYINRVPGFVGVVMKDGKPDNDVSGPDGVLLAGGEVWAGDGDSTVKVIDAAAQKIVAAISTGGATRVDEMAYDPKDKVFLAVNNA